MKGWFYSLALVAVVGCGPTVEDVCDHLEASCPEIGGDCVADGEELDDRASDEGCDDLFTDYLACLDVATCDWRLECGEERTAIEDCVGELPP